MPRFFFYQSFYFLDNTHLKKNILLNHYSICAHESPDPAHAQIVQ